jgi:hypothetical protein
MEADRRAKPFGVSRPVAECSSDAVPVLDGLAWARARPPREKTRLPELATPPLECSHRFSLVIPGQ